jgi:hypothetical protein
MSQPHRGSTHSGVDFTASRDSVTLLRGLGVAIGRADGVPPQAPLGLQANVEAIWDGRLSVTASEPGWRIVPARNAHRLAFENEALRLDYERAAERFGLRPLAGDRIAHAFGPDINRAKP